jgi:ABC-2 type transport system ATP-binding protein
MMPAIETIGLSKSYGSTRAVVDLDLQVAPGQVFAFLGPNGAGKSTTIRMLLALQRPTAGTARLLGLDAQTESVAVHRKVGYLPGDLELYPRMTGQRHLDWFARARGGVDRQYVNDLVERFDVVLNRPIRELSKGNRQKIGVVIAFMAKPQLLILDEPTSGLDPLMQHEFERLVRETIADDRTVFLSSHELDEVQRVADRVAIIKEGRLLVTDTMEGLGRTLPRKIEVRFRAPVAPSVFATLRDVRVAATDGPHVTLELTGPIGPVLTVVAANDPVDLLSQPPDLDELFLSFYRTPPSPEPADAH